MLRCPSCKTRHPNNTLFCDQCGARLAGSGALDGTADIGPEKLGSQTPVPPVERPETPQQIILSVSGVEKALPFPLQKKLVLGRTDPVRGRAPEVDLAPHHAYDSGVSRQHAALYQVGDYLYLEDLSSRNGTFVNGRRLAPFQAEPIDHGDEIRLGTLSIVVLLR